MGACACTTSQKSVNLAGSMPALEMPLSYYLDRKKGYLLTLEGKQIKKQKIRATRKFRTDAAMGVTADKRIYLAGGTDSADALQSDFLQIDPRLRSTEYLTPLPIPSKMGSLITFGQWVYYVGCLLYTSDAADE